MIAPRGVPAVWRPDVLDGFSRTDIPLLPGSTLVAGESDTPIGGVLVRRDPPGDERPAVLYLHGWNDYFFQTHLADFWAGLGYAFYALDLRRYGRALQPGQYFGYITDLGDYAREIDGAVATIRSAGHDRIVLMGHSTGGLTGALYADSHPGVFEAVVLNSPWLELSGNAVLRQLVTGLVTGAARMAPTTVLPMTDQGFYRRTILASEGGEWDFDTAWKRSPAPIRLGWGRAIVRGHEQVAAGLDIAAPVIVLCSDHSATGLTWTDEMERADTVLDADGIARRAPYLGRHVTVVRIHDGLHDLTLSPAPVRAAFFRALGTWVAAYCGL
ncbi:alpha/beta hydrolase [Raineyella sp. LH-20]|uniref:alpha/beta hydrolase n=1 Tax=Raineyella sp. LH-20 TaxID=3081204 RepID=UPI002954E51C|nr:alpha/beta hydrolase [Raineyella sp. LH-20]WOP20153.1 alpha/beta hydrolase [Raineyella sp. LH-20]